MRLDMVGIVANNMNSSIQFYRNLGFSVIGDTNEPYVELDNNGVRISINSKEMVAGIYGFTPETAGNCIELAFLIDSRAELDVLTLKMKTLGYTVFKEPWDAFWGQRYAILQDPDGHLISLFAE